MNVKQLKTILSNLKDDTEIYVCDETNEYTDILQSVEIRLLSEDTDKFSIIFKI